MISREICKRYRSFDNMWIEDIHRAMNTNKRVLDAFSISHYIGLVVDNRFQHNLRYKQSFEVRKQMYCNLAKSFGIEFNNNDYIPAE